MGDMALRVRDDVVCPPAAQDGYTSAGDSVPYITQLLTPLASTHHLVALCDDACLRVFDKSRLGAPLHTLQVSETDGLTALSNLESMPACWLGASRHGYAALWDARTPTASPATQLRGPSGAAYVSLATQGSYVACGTELKVADAYIDLWDVRQMSAPVCTYEEAHSDDVTSLAFHAEPSHAGVLLSGGMDGLVCAIDTHMASEDDAVISVGNTNASLARVSCAARTATYQFQPAAPPADLVDASEGALSQDPRRAHLGPVVAVSNMQTLSLWDADKVRRGADASLTALWRAPRCGRRRASARRGCRTM